MHAHVLGQFRLAAGQRRQHADLAAVHVGTDHAVGNVQTHRAAHLDILTDFLDQGLTRLFHGGAVFQAQRHDLGGVHFVGVQGGLGHLVGEAQEVVVTGHEVGFGVDFHHHRALAVFGGSHHHHAFGGGAAGFLGGFRLAGFAQIVDRALNVTLGGDQGLLALHHAETGALAELFNH